MDIKQVIDKLLKDANITKYQISKATGISQVSLNKFAKGESDLDNMPLGNALKLYDFYLKNEEDIMMTNDKRDILFGQLLSIVTVIGERVFEKGKPSVDETSFKKFPRAPKETITRLHMDVMNYAHKFGKEENELIDLFGEILYEMESNDFTNDPLDKYLLGYYKQNHELAHYRTGGKDQ